MDGRTMALMKHSLLSHWFKKRGEGGREGEREKGRWEGGGWKFVIPSSLGSALISSFLASPWTPWLSLGYYYTSYFPSAPSVMMLWCFHPLFCVFPKINNFSRISFTFFLKVKPGETWAFYQTDLWVLMFEDIENTVWQIIIIINVPFVLEKVKL